MGSAIVWRGWKKNELYSIARGFAHARYVELCTTSCKVHHLSSPRRKHHQTSSPAPRLFRR
ncbi:hypothetical protein J6590_018715 [Homalodisca vitripennis]|nr:hypothetical protein J6590_018715 [Homalodisca vitripennis]